MGKNNWHIIDTVDGAKASAFLYNIVEIAKANYLKPYDYFKHLFDEIPKNMEDKNTDFWKNFFPGQNNCLLSAENQ